MSCFGSKFLLAKPAGCKVAGCAHPHPFATGSSADDRTGLADERASSGKFSIQTIQSIVGHADTEMTEHYLHVQESIRQSAIQLFSEAFSA